MKELDISADLVYKIHAKKILDQFYSEDKKETASKQPKQKTKKSKKEDDLNQKEKMQSHESMKVKRSQRKRRVEKTENSIDDVQKLDNLYLNGHASFGSAMRLQNLSKLSMKKTKMYLKTKPYFNKYCSRRLRFPRLKVVVYDINEICSVGLA